MPVMLRFLRAAFHYSIGATTHMEVSFAHMNAFLQKAWRPPHVSCVAEHHTLTELKRAHARWLDGKSTFLPSTLRLRGRSRKGRPVRAHAVRRNNGRKNASGLRLHGVHMYLSSKYFSLRAQLARRPLETKTSYHYRVLKKAHKSWKGLSQGRR